MGVFAMEEGKTSSTSVKNTFEKEEPRDKGATRFHFRAFRLSATFKGLALAFLSAIFFSVRSLSVKYLEDIHPAQLSIYAYLAMCALSLPPAVRSGESFLVPRKHLIPLVICSIFGAASVFLNYVAFQYLPLGEATVIILNIPIFATIAGRLFLKETCGVIQSISVIITAVGMIFIMKIPETILSNSVSYTTNYVYGLAAAFVSLFSGTWRLILIRKIRSVHHSITVFYNCYVGMLVTALVSVIFVKFRLCQCGLQQGLAAVLGVFSYFGMLLIIMALQMDYVGPVSTVRTASDIILAFVFQSLMFDDVPDVYSIAGATLVGLSLVLVALRNWAISLPSDSSAAKHLRFLLL